MPITKKNKNLNKQINSEKTKHTKHTKKIVTITKKSKKEKHDSDAKNDAKSDGNANPFPNKLSKMQKDLESIEPIEPIESIEPLEPLKPISILSTGLVNEPVNNMSSKLSKFNKFTQYKIPLNEDIVRPKIWELPNRKRFYDWVLSTFSKYETGNLSAQIKAIAKDDHTGKSKGSNKGAGLNTERLHLNNIQRLTRDFMQGESPARGLLFYIGLGVGKTCAAVAVSEAIQTKKEVIILSKTSLEDNFRKEILQCGTDYMKTHNHWVFKSCTTEDEREFATTILNVPSKSIIENGGAFFIDFSKDDANYSSLTKDLREKLRIQINYLIEARFKFLHTDNTRLIGTLADDVFDEKVVIVDEVHNMGNTMVSETSKSGPRFYELFMKAKNPKYIFLSGTPLINQVFESTRIFNILRGYMPTLIVKFKSSFESTINYDNLKYLLLKNRFVDQIVINYQNKIMKVSKNPDYFINDVNGKGIIYSNKPDDIISIDTFAEQVTKIIAAQGYKITIDIKLETALPENKVEFEQRFYNPDLNKLKHIDLIKRRIAGLTSYYEYQDKSKYPKLLPINYVRIPMSTYQFGVYERLRHQELEKERFKKRKAGDNESASSYRIKSRLACTFVFPEETGSPYDKENDAQKAEFIEMLADKDSQFDMTVTNIEEMREDEIVKYIKARYLNIIYKNRDQYLDISNGSLAKHSPKYLEMIKNIQKSPGKILVYSYFRYLIGLNTFSYALMQTGEWEPFKVRKVNKQWELDDGSDGDGDGDGDNGDNGDNGEKGAHKKHTLKGKNKGANKRKRKFLFYTGNEDREIREIYRNVYNSLWDQLPASCEKLVQQLKEIADSNHYGEVVQMLMTTRTGAEGLDLKEVRQIHIMEPYWQPVLIDQVIGRGVRNESHLKLPVIDRNVEVFLYMATITPLQVSKISYPDVRLDTYKYPNPALADKKNKVVTSDEYLYILAERKKIVINEFQKLMKESAFDCALNYHDNKMNPANEGLVCLDYATQNRADYLFTPDIDDTVESIDLAQEKIVSTTFKTVAIKGVMYYYPVEANSDGKTFIYDKNIVGRVRLPKPVGEIRIINDEMKKVFYKKKSK
jgi:hypothetical protein